MNQKFLINSKGQLIAIDAALSGLLGIIIVGMLLVALWPMASNILSMGNTIPNYNLYRPLADFVPAILFIAVIIGIILAMRGQGQQQGGI
jgi:hypothetical protein